MLILYASELCNFQERDVSVVLRRLALQPREEYRSGFPELGAIVQAVRRERGQREAHERRAREKAEEHEARCSRVLDPERWFTAEMIADGIVERLKAQYGKDGFDWTKPYSPKPYEPEAE